MCTGLPVHKQPRRRTQVRCVRQDRGPVGVFSVRVRRVRTVRGGVFVGPLERERALLRAGADDAAGVGLRPRRVRLLFVLLSLFAHMNFCVFLLQVCASVDSVQDGFGGTGAGWRARWAPVRGAGSRFLQRRRGVRDWTEGRWGETCGDCRVWANGVQAPGQG